MALPLPVEMTRRVMSSTFIANPSRRIVQENPGETFTYVVQRGDTLAGVALRLGVKQSELKRANHMYGSKTLMTGQVITENRGSCCIAALGLCLSPYRFCDKTPFTEAVTRFYRCVRKQPELKYVRCIQRVVIRSTYGLN